MTTPPLTTPLCANDSTAAEVEEALGHLLHATKREFHIIGTTEHPTPYDRRHASLNDLLDLWQHAIGQ